MSVHTFITCPLTGKLTISGICRVANRRRPIIQEGAKHSQRWHTLHPADSRQLVYHD